jgi:hypothetical protein
VLLVRSVLKSSSNPVQPPIHAPGNFIDDEWFEYGPELEGPGSESASRDTGMSRADNLHMQADWRRTMDAANAAVIAANG